MGVGGWGGGGGGGEREQRQGQINRPVDELRVQERQKHYIHYEYEIKF